MLYRKETRKSVDQVFADIEAASKAHGFGVLHHYDFKQTLGSKGFPLANECRVITHLPIGSGAAAGSGCRSRPSAAARPRECSPATPAELAWAPPVWHPVRS